MIEVLAAAGSDIHWTWLIFGRMHPMVVHFPIALILVAALLEGWGLVRRRTAAGDPAWICVSLGSLSAIVVTIMGYAFADQKSPSPELELHERFGLITTIAAVLTMAVAWRARRSGGTGGPAAAYRAFLFAVALGVSVTGHLGGELVYGSLFDGTWLERKKPLQTPKDPPVPVAVNAVDFEKEIAPIIKASCLKCHSATPPNKVKSKLRLDTKETAFKGGSGGKVLIPGKPDESTFYTLLITDSEDERMPEKAPALPKEKTDLVKKWIEQGAPWPDGFEIK